MPKPWKFYQKFLLYKNNGQQYEKLYQNLGELKRKPQGDQKIKINLDIIQDPPPPEGSKKVVFRLRSVNNIVKQPANTGSARRKNKEGGNNQKLMLFKRGNTISGKPNIRGTNQFPNPPIIIGITIKKIIKNAWAVTTTL